MAASLDTAGASASTLARTLGPAGGTQTQVGPGLYMHMGEAALIDALNAWGSAKDREVLALKADLLATQVGISGAFQQAQGAVQGIVDAFRTEAQAMRQATFHEAQQSIVRLEEVVNQARARFDDQDVRFAAGLAELARGVLAADAWAQAEPARVAALVQAALAQAAPPAPPRTTTRSPNTTPITATR